MKKCSAFVSIDSTKKTVLDFEIGNCRNVNFFGAIHTNYGNIHNLYENVLTVLKNNGYTVNCTDSFNNRKLYDITIVDIADGKINKFYI